VDRVRAYLELARAGFRRYAAYPLATAAGGITNSIFGLLRASVVVAAVAGAGGELAGYDRELATSYAWLTQALIAPVALFTWSEVADRVRTGDIAIDLARPVDLQFAFLAADYGRAVYQLLPRAVPPIAVGMLTFGMVLPHDPLTWLVTAVSLTLAVGVSFGCRFLANLTSFWLLDNRGAMTLYMLVSGALCGLYVPVPWFPPWLHAVATATPFPSMLQTPADVLTGRLTAPAAVLEAVGVQILWLAVVMVSGRAVLARAARKMVIQGG
jgi:viologen exporter family transport system permease protein